MLITTCAHVAAKHHKSIYVTILSPRVLRRRHGGGHFTRCLETLYLMVCRHWTFFSRMVCCLSPLKAPDFVDTALSFARASDPQLMRNTTTLRLVRLTKFARAVLLLSCYTWRQSAPSPIASSTSRLRNLSSLSRMPWKWTMYSSLPPFMCRAPVSDSTAPYLRGCHVCGRHMCVTRDGWHGPQSLRGDGGEGNAAHDAHTENKRRGGRACRKDPCACEPLRALRAQGACESFCAPTEARRTHFPVSLSLAAASSFMVALERLSLSSASLKRHWMYLQEDTARGV